MNFRLKRQETFLSDSHISRAWQNDEILSEIPSEHDGTMMQLKFNTIQQ